MIRIATTEAAFEAVAGTLPLGSLGYEAHRGTDGEVHIWIEDRWADKLAAMRRPGESYSDVIMRQAAEKA